MVDYELMLKWNGERWACDSLGIPFTECKEFKPTKGTKMNKKLMQIRLDEQTNQTKKLRVRVSEMEATFSQLQREVNCAEDYGHEYVFVVKVANPRYGCLSDSPLYLYRYKCSRCGRTVDCTWDELTVKEHHALETLGIAE